MHSLRDRINRNNNKTTRLPRVQGLTPFANPALSRSCPSFSSIPVASCRVAHHHNAFVLPMSRTRSVRRFMAGSKNAPGVAGPSFRKSPRRAAELGGSHHDAGARAGVFFGRLNRRFDVVSSRRFSGPSAEFISVNEVWLQFAPMNNPYRCTSRLCGHEDANGFLQPW